MAPTETERENENPSSPLRRKTELGDLGDDELFQVLVRVPQKTARMMRAVARRWNSIICSSPDYAVRLCSNHPESDDHALLLLTQRGCQNLLMLPPSEEEAAEALEKCHIDLSYVADGCYHRCITSTSEDLALISFRRDLFVCNPFTKESVRLPPSPSSFSYLVKESVRLLPPSPSYLSSIVCEEPTTTTDHNNSNIRRRYRVVHYSLRLTGFCFRSVFVSETGRWNDITTTSGPPWIWEFAHQSADSPFYSRKRKKIIYPVAYAGKLHWFNGKDSVVYDPFQDIFTVIPGPGPKQQRHMVVDHFGYWLGVVHGSLTLAKFDYECGPVVDLCYIFIWELDCERGLWMLRNKSWFQKPDTINIQDMEIAALHPTQDIVYFTISNDNIGLHDLSKGSDNFSKVLLPANASYDFYKFKSFLLARSWRPTSVSYHGSDCLCLPEFPRYSFYDNVFPVIY